MRNVEIRKTQLGLMGFGKETDAQLEAKQKAQEREKRIRIIPSSVIIYIANQPDKGYTHQHPFYVLKPEKPTTRDGMEIVRIDSDNISVYHDGDHQVWSKGMVIEVNYKKMVKKK